MRNRVQLIYDRDCPNVAEARKVLLQAFKQTGLPAAWTEWARTDPDSPAHARLFGSPAILVDGKDVVGLPPGQMSDCCRLYTGHDGSSRAPSVDDITAALNRKRFTSGWRGVLPLPPALGAALLPVGACPACWPAYAGLLGSLGLGFLLEARYVLPITFLFMLAALLPLAWKPRRGHRPFILGLAGAALMLLGKFALSLDPLLYGGLALLIGASAWNAWPRPPDSCAACTEYP